ncbi:hypothetical protein EB796_005362 [Bugula neritina]|uniref:Uncharacterized protein n=1 Tax=Bugula neritina TaxID=10212 RepID=A0A7J7KFD5_BUGNE|nr:hypothetical protein EB796_005362 [Bugula neritina]
MRDDAGNMLVTGIILLFLSGVAANSQFDEALFDLESRLKKLELEHKAYQNVISTLARQITMQQFYVEEVSRSSGDSGLKQSRLTHSGTRSYHTTSFSDLKVAAIHDHSNYKTTIGMGEVIAVLNGVEFRTRHNDYKLVMPSTKSINYGATEPVPFPPVPPEVLAQPSVELQEEEMRLWFKAFQEQDPSVRDYRKYFKPVLCYMEGMWTEATNNKLDEPFSSDRHKLDAENFFDLQEKARYTSATGRKSISENYAYLPSTLSGMSDNGMPLFSQWNYKILCHPLKKEVPLNRFRLEDDLSVRVARAKTYEQAKLERFARFSLWPAIAGPNSPFRPSKEGYTSLTTGSFLDSLMAEIPGKDNYVGEIKDDVFNETALDHDYKHPTGNQSLPRPPKNVAYYHRLYRTKTKDAMGSEIRHRAFSDASLYIAYNTRPQITPSKVEWCVPNKDCHLWQASRGECKTKKCSNWSDRVSYAIPLEIIYLTPLHSWNPYNFEYNSDDRVPVTWNTNGTYRRNGDHSERMAIYGNSRQYFYRTPHTFFDGQRAIRDSADSLRFSMSVMDSQGQIWKTRASGIHIMTPNIPGVGVVRQRYPIMPVHQAGSMMFKEIDALKDVTLEAAAHRRFYRDKVYHNGTIEEVFTFEVGLGDKSAAGPHHHTVDITESEIKRLKRGERVTVLTSSSAGHDHEITLEYRVAVYPEKRKTIEHLFLTACDGRGWTCYDGHKGWVICNECADQFPDVNM